MNNKFQHTITKYEPNFLRNIKEEIIYNVLSSKKRKIVKYEKS